MKYLLYPLDPESKPQLGPQGASGRQPPSALAKISKHTPATSKATQAEIYKLAQKMEVEQFYCPGFAM